MKEGMMEIQPRRLLAAALLAGAVLAGCGDSGPTQAEFAREVNAACRQAFAAPADSSEGAAAEEVSPAVRLRRLVERLDATEAPADLEEQYAQYREAVAGLVEIARATEGSAELSRSEDTAIQERLQRSQETMLSSARALRLSDCV